MDWNKLFDSCTTLLQARTLHSTLVVSGQLPSSLLLSTKLVTLYSRLSDLPSSVLLFRRTPNPNLFLFNSLLSAYVRHSHFPQALLHFRLLLLHSASSPLLRPDRFTLPLALKASTSPASLHSLLLKLGFASDVFVSSSLLSAYSKLGLVRDAVKVFDEMPVRDTACWNSILSGFAHNGCPDSAEEIFHRMVERGVRIDRVTVSSVLPVCAPLDDLLMGVGFHVYVVKCGLDLDLYVSNALLDMYAKLGFLGSARRVFDGIVEKDLVSWNSMVSAYEQAGCADVAVGLFFEMRRFGFRPDALTVVSLASAAAQMGGGQIGRSVHAFCVVRGWFGGDIFVGNAIVDMYGKLGEVEDMHRVFDRMPVRDIISWNSLITGFSQNGLAGKAIEVYESMGKCEGVTSEQGTLVSVLPACSHIGALREGMKIHGRAIRTGHESDVFVGTCLIDLYAKCGRVVEATLLFEQVPRKSSAPWNAIIAGLGVHGHGDKAMGLFQQMQQERVKPDHVTFVSLLSACSHSGLVDPAHWCFQIMKERYGIEPTVKHYACMVDLLGRAGRLDDAYEFIKNMPTRPDACVWGALLGACRIHGNVEMGKVASSHLFQIDPENVGYYVLMSNMYAKVGNWEGVDEVRSLARHRQLMKTPGWTSIEVNNKVNVFFTGNQSHPRYKEIYREIVILSAKMKSLGYVPDYSFVLQDVEEDEKEHILNTHSERLAIAFGIISTSPNTPIQISKNLRICGDCHDATKFISRITEREIIVRDSNRFHHFKGESCSCGDYW